MTRSAHLRERILKVAGEKFLSQGFYKVSIDSLVTELRTSKSSIYKHFPSKEELVRTLVEQVNAIIDRQLEQLLGDPELNFEEKLLQFTRFGGKLQRLIGAQFLTDLRVHIPGLWEANQRQGAERIQKYYHQLFRQGIEEGIVREDIDLSFTVTAYLQLTGLTANQENRGELPYGDEEIYRRLTNLLLDGIVNPYR